MKLLTLFGTRPEIIRLSEVVKLLDRLCDQVLVHTGQNYDHTLSDIFFAELSLRSPDKHLGVRAARFPEQVSQILTRVGQVLDQEAPERLLVLGDTNSALAAIIAARMGIPVYHMEAGNRCYDNRVPEEVNRRLIDHCSDVLMPYTQRSKENLVREGIERERVFVIGNPIFEVLKAHDEDIDASSILSELRLTSREYFLATLHRAENVDNPQRLERLFTALSEVGAAFEKPVVVSVHPHTADRLSSAPFHLKNDNLILLKPLGFFDFVRLEKSALCVMSDSGTVQEECCILKVPNVTLRDTTERPETIECGSSILTGTDKIQVLGAVQCVLDSGTSWVPPAEYLCPRVSATVARLVTGFRRPAP